MFNPFKHKSTQSISIKIDLMSNIAQTPFKPSNENDGAYDLLATSRQLEYNEFGEPLIIYGLGFKTEIPKGYRVMIIPRSSIKNKTLTLANSQGLVDARYRDEWFVIFRLTTPIHINNNYDVNTTKTVPGLYDIGDRIAQCYIEKIIDINWELSNIDNSTSGGGGFGSTGDKIIVNKSATLYTSPTEGKVIRYKPNNPSIYNK